MLYFTLQNSYYFINKDNKIYKINKLNEKIIKNNKEFCIKSKQLQYYQS